MENRGPRCGRISGEKRDSDESAEYVECTTNEMYYAISNTFRAHEQHEKSTRPLLSL